MTLMCSSKFKNRTFWLGAASAIALLGPVGGAIAAQGAAQEPVVMDEIVVTGQRWTAAQAALGEQRDAVGVATLISGEELRDQPQANLADLLTRLPGISSSADMSRLQAGTGEAQYVSIRGLDTSYNAFSFDGVRLAQTDQNTRAISMNLLSPFSLATVRVDKAPTAESDGDALAGVIDFRTADAFDFGENMFQVRSYLQSAELAENTGQDHLGYAFQVEGALLSADRRFGVYLSAYATEKDTAGWSTAMQRDWEKLNVNVPGTTRENEGNLHGAGVQWNYFRNNIRRQGFTANFDFRGEAHSFYWRTTAGEYEILSTLDQASLRRELPAAAGQINPNPSTNGGRYNANGLRADFGIMNGGYFRTEDSEHTLITSKLGGQSILNDVTFDYHVAYSKGEQLYPLRLEAAWYGLPYIGTPGQVGTALATLEVGASDPRHPRAILTPEANAYLNDPSNTRQWYVQGGFDEAWEEKTEAGLTADWDVDLGMLTSIEGGFKLESSDRYSNGVDPGRNRYRFPGGGLGVNQAQFWQPQGAEYFSFPGETLNTFMGGGTQTPLRLVDRATIERQYRELAVPGRPYNETDLSENRVEGEEVRNSIFVQGVFERGALTVIPGVRVEDNSFTANYAQRQRVAGGANTLVRVTSERSYTQTLPSVVASYRPNENTVYRAVARKSYSRPSFDLLFGPVNISYATDGVTPVSIYEPNPDLNAVEAISFDLSAEYYSRGTDFVTASLFYKDLSNVIFASGTTNARGNHNASTSVPTQIGGIEYTRLNNEGSGSVLGLELAGSYTLPGLPGILDGLSIGGNITLQESEAEVIYGGEERTLMLPHAPEVMYNAEIEYNRDGLTMVLNYNYMGLRLLSLRGDRPDTYAQPNTRLNFMSTYEFDNGVTVGASVENILDEHSYWATTGENEAYLSADRQGGYVEAGRIFMMSLSYRY